MKIQTFTRTNLKTLRAAIDAALEGVAAQHDIQIETGSASFSANNATFRLELATHAEDGVVQTPERAAFQPHATQYGLSPDDLDRTFTRAGTRYTIIGLNTRAPRFPVQAQSDAGKTYRFPAEAVVAALARSVA